MVWHPVSNQVTEFEEYSYCFPCWRRRTSRGRILTNNPYRVIREKKGRRNGVVAM